MDFDGLKLNRMQKAQKMGDKSGKSGNFHDMKAAGFRYVDCIWKFRHLAIMIIIK
jgi:hypothetical protein